MKKMIPLVLVLVGLTFGCKSLQTGMNSSNGDAYQSIAKAVEGFRCVPFPAGATAQQAGDRVKIILPDDQYYIVNLNNSTLQLPPLTAVFFSCRCADGKPEGCAPILFRGEFYCLPTQLNCYPCRPIKITLGPPVIVSPQQAEIIGIHGIDRSPIQFVVKNLSKDPAKQKQETLKAYFPNVPDEILSMEETRPAVMAFFNQIYNGQIPDFIMNNEDAPNNNYVYAAASLYGNLIYLPIPKDMATKNPIFGTLSVETMATKVACNCQSGKTGCKLGSFLGMKYCSAQGCTNCSLQATTSIK
jgi:hypothetical protein